MHFPLKKFTWKYYCDTCLLFGPKQLSILGTYFTILLYLMLNYIPDTAGKRSFDIYHFHLLEKYASKHLPGFIRLIFQRKSYEHTRKFDDFNYISIFIVFVFNIFLPISNYFAGLNCITYFINFKDNFRKGT